MAITSLSTDTESPESETGLKTADITAIEETLELYFGDSEYEQELPISISMYAATMTEFENGEISGSGYLDDKLSFEVSEVGDSGDFIHSIDVKGVLHNAGEEMNFATVKVVFYDAAGNVLCGAYKSIDSIPANGDVEVQFHTGLYGEENPFDHYEVYVFRGTA